MPSPYRDTNAHGAATDLEPHARAREAAYANVSAQLRSAPRVARLVTDAAGEGWALDLPRDKAAAAEYLKGIEHARAMELEAIRTLRRRIEGEAGTAEGRRRLRALTVMILLATVAWGVWSWQARPSGPADSTAARATQADHSAHGAMGSGVAVEVSDSRIAVSRSIADPGVTTFILRNIGGDPTGFFVVPRSRLRGSAASMSPERLHQVAVAAKHELEPGSREELAVELVVGEYLLFASHPQGASRAAPFSVG